MYIFIVNIFLDFYQNAFLHKVMFGIVSFGSRQYKIVPSEGCVFDKIEGKEGDELREFYWNLIKSQINKKMPTYKYIKNVIITTEPLIKTTTNKVKRFEEISKTLEEEKNK